MPRRFFAILALSLALLAPAYSQAVDTAAIDKIMQEALQTWQVPGAAIAVVKGDEVVYMKGYGVRERGGTKPVTPQTLFAIGSTTKAFTTTAMAMLVDEGKMAWDDPVRKYIEFFHLSDPLADQDVTLRDLVCHRTGLSRHDELWYGSPWGRQEIIRKIGLAKLTKPFRSTWQYQNIMFLTAGYAVGAAAKTSWEDFVQKRIFDPLGMTGADCSVTVAEKAPDHATPHRKKEDGKIEAIPWRNIDNIAPAGSINAGVSDLSKWVRFQLGDGAFQGKRLVSAANLEETHTPQMVERIEGPAKAVAQETETTQMSYGLAWQIHDYRGHLLVEHGGGIDGFLTSLTLVPKSKWGVAILSNLSPASLQVSARNSVLDLLLGLPRKDWNTIYAGQTKKAEEERKAREKEREAKRVKGTKPSRELPAYAGAYEDPAYGSAHVSLESGSLVLEWSNFKSRLEHFHFDTFASKGDNPLGNEQVPFALGTDGDVATMDLFGQAFKKVKPKSEARQAGGTY